MRRLAWISIVVIALVAVGVVFAAVLNFRAHLTGDQERPDPVDTDANGQAVLHLNREGDELRYRLIVTNLEDITQAHIHCGNPDVAGPLVAFLFGLEPAGVTVNGVLAEGTITAANIIVRPDSPECPGGVADFDDLIEKMQSGGAYVNVHTLEFTAGEIRGHVHVAGNPS